eukprot:scaffold7218_cov52-Attheya_sp.AAC.6
MQVDDEYSEYVRIAAMKWEIGCILQNKARTTPKFVDDETLEESGLRSETTAVLGVLVGSVRSSRGRDSPWESDSWYRMPEHGLLTTCTENGKADRLSNIISSCTSAHNILSPPAWLHHYSYPYLVTLMLHARLDKQAVSHFKLEPSLHVGKQQLCPKEFLSSLRESLYVAYVDYDVPVEVLEPTICPQPSALIGSAPELALASLCSFQQKPLELLSKPSAGGGR